VVIDDFEGHARKAGLTVGRLPAGGHVFLHLAGLTVPAGSHAGEACEVAILRTTESPWVPQAAIHVRPHLVTMGQFNSQASPVGSDWQYLSRRFDRVPTPRSFLAHIFTVLSEL
jgi:hypothetical protein